MALAQGSALKRDNWSPGDPRRGGRLWHFDRRFRQLLGYSEHVLAPLHFLPDILRHHASPRPQHGEVIKKVGAFTDHESRLPLTASITTSMASSASFFAILAGPR